MKNFILKSILFSFIFSIFLLWTYFAIQARSTSNPNLTESAPTGGLFVTSNETLTAAKRNAMANRVQSFPLETLAAWVAGTEQDMGIKRIDGKEIYRKVINLWLMSDAGTTPIYLSVNHNISWVADFIDIKWFTYKSWIYFNLSDYQWAGTSFSTSVIWTALRCDNIKCFVKYTWWRTDRDAIIIIEYTKN
mgnify:CR=1 FL=1